MVIPVPRIQAPGTAAKGELFQVKAIISHPMETGLRHDEQGKTIPRLIINTFSCLYNDEIVFSVELHEAVAANPYFEFTLRATQSGQLKFVWKEDGGGVYTLSHDITVG
jgi:sulfur-oxidizing protein SoxZ